MIRLGDDGTMDTVLVCDECGQEIRYNFDPSGPDTIDDIQQDYDAFVDWAIEDATESHECEQD